MALRLSEFARYLKTPEAARALEPFARRMAERLPEVDSTSSRIGAELAGRAPRLPTGPGLDRAVLGALAEDAEFGAPLEPGIIATRLLDAFSTASRGGTLDRATVERRLGSEAARLLDQATGAFARAPAEAGSPRFAGLEPTTRAHLGAAGTTTALRSRMPALQAS
ncbi:MAG: hypothetical protein K1X89_17730, partial [Myxococcaceae bacterium]|nr:hypothetical protein [Myxococcaceae bacterium]